LTNIIKIYKKKSQPPFRKLNINMKIIISMKSQKKYLEIVKIE